MHTNKSTEVQGDNKSLTFIEKARRRQIIEATVSVLAEYGYTNTSFSRIAQQAGISTSLIRYHFKSKENLMRLVFDSLQNSRVEHVLRAVAFVEQPKDKLRIAIEQDLMNLGSHLEQWQAITEILFSFRNTKGALIYNREVEDSSCMLLHDILLEGQEKGAFSNVSTVHLAIIIDAARDTFLTRLALTPELNLKKFISELIEYVFIILDKKGV